MNERATHLPPPVEDEDLAEQASGWAEALRTIARRWRFRAQAGRLGRHALGGVIRMAERFEDAAALLDHEPGTNGRGAVGRGDELLQASEDRFRLLVDSVQEYAIFMLDPEGRVASWNAGAERLKGYKAEEIIGRHFSTFYTPDAIASAHPQHELALASRDGRYAEEGWRLRKDGSRFWANVTITALRDPSGKLRGFGKVTRDFTDRKRAEDEIRQLNADLEQRVRDRTAELEAINAELEAFSYSVSHDLRTPLRGIDGFARMLGQKYTDLLDERGRHYLDRIRAGTQRMAKLIDDLLRLSRISRAALRFVPLDLGGLAGEVCEELRRAQPARAVTLKLARTVPVSGDPQLLRVLLENLLGNAWKFTARTEGAVIEFGIDDSGGRPAYFVRDNGAGFDMTYADRLFGAFQRLHDDSEFEGTGIGLATAQRIVNKHGGRIWAEGRPGQGATFWFTIGDGTSQ